MVFVIIGFNIQWGFNEMQNAKYGLIVGNHKLAYQLLEMVANTVGMGDLMCSETGEAMATSPLLVHRRVFI